MIRFPVSNITFIQQMKTSTTGSKHPQQQPSKDLLKTTFLHFFNFRKYYYNPQQHNLNQLPPENVTVNFRESASLL